MTQGQGERPGHADSTPADATPNDDPRDNGVAAPPTKEVAGALVAAVGLFTVVLIVIVAITTLPASGKSQNVVAIATSAFGVIGAVVGAYFGLRTAKNALDQ